MSPGWITAVPQSIPVRGTVWPAVDVGGTGIRVVLLAADDDGHPHQVLPPHRVATQRGLRALLSRLRTTLAAASTEAAAHGWQTAPVIAVGAPGRIERRADGARVIAPRSATNLEAAPGELDGVDLAAELATALSLPVSQVFWDNDAVVQGISLISELLRSPEHGPQLLGQTVVCINPGTGLGGCVAAVAADGNIEVFTDSHISELLLHPVTLHRTISHHQLSVSSSASAQEIFIAIGQGNQRSELALPSPVGKQAEDLLAGTGLSRIATGIERLGSSLDPPVALFSSAQPIDGPFLSRLLEPVAVTHNPAIAVQTARFVGDLAGLALARLIRLLNDGTARKCPGFPDWTGEELCRLRGVCRFVLGGGIAKTPLGKHIVTTARQDLPPTIDPLLFEVELSADQAATAGAFLLIPPEMREESTTDPCRRR